MPLLTKQVRGELLTAVRAALHRAAQDGERVTFKGINVRIEDKLLYLQVSAEPFPSDDDVNYFLLVFTELTPIETRVEEFDATERSAEHISVLEQELQYTREHLQATIEELETTNEELQATNEELVASNEELQSTNEELHSVNEELYTVNSEYQQKINELLTLTDDMQNLQRSSKVRTLFLDRDNRIRDFTPATRDMFNLLPQDIGRPIEHLLYNLNLGGDELKKMTRAVAVTREPIELEITAPDEHHYLMQILPYLRDGTEVDGVVINMTDISEIVEAERTIRRSEQRYRAIADTLEQLICRYEHDGTLTYINQSYCDYFDRSADELLGNTFFNLIPPEDHDAARASIDSLTADNPRKVVEHRVELASGIVRWQQWVDQAILDENGNIVEYQGVGLDITERKQIEERQTRRKARMSAILDNTHSLIGLLSANGEVVEMGQYGRELLGLESVEAIQGCKFIELPSIVEDNPDALWQDILNAIEQNHSALVTLHVKKENSDILPIQLRLRPVRNAEDELVFIVPESDLDS